MNLTVSGKQIDVGDSLRAHVERELVSSVGKYFGDAVEGSVVFSRDGYQFRVDVSVHIGRNIIVQSQGMATDAYAAYEIASDHVAKRLRRYKRRLRDHHQRVGRNGQDLAARHIVLAAEPEDLPEREPAEPGPAIIAEMRADIPTLTVGEAVMRLDLAHEPALMFRNSANGLMNMVYRRRDGNIGWVDPANAPH
jgi:ribosomal subunit interface protein